MILSSLSLPLQKKKILRLLLLVQPVANGIMLGKGVREKEMSGGGAYENVGLQRERGWDAVHGMGHVGPAAVLGCSFLSLCTLILYSP